jgi:hypothetical protein
LTQSRQILVQFVLGFPGGFLGSVDGVAEQIAGLTNALGIHAFFEFDALGFQEFAKTLEQLILLDRFHSFARMLTAV